MCLHPVSPCSAERYLVKTLRYQRACLRHIFLRPTLYFWTSASRSTRHHVSAFSKCSGRQILTVRHTTGSATSSPVVSRCNVRRLSFAHLGCLIWYLTGSVLDPLLFLIFISCLPRGISTPCTKLNRLERFAERAINKTRGCHCGT